MSLVYHGSILLYSALVEASEHVVMMSNLPVERTNFM